MTKYYDPNSADPNQIHTFIAKERNTVNTTIHKGHSDIPYAECGQYLHMWHIAHPTTDDVMNYAKTLDEDARSHLVWCSKCWRANTTQPTTNSKESTMKNLNRVTVTTTDGEQHQHRASTIKIEGENLVLWAGNHRAATYRNWAHYNSEPINDDTDKLVTDEHVKELENEIKRLQSVLEGQVQATHQSQITLENVCTAKRKLTTEWEEMRQNNVKDREQIKRLAGLLENTRNERNALRAQLRLHQNSCYGNANTLETLTNDRDNALKSLKKLTGELNNLAIQNDTLKHQKDVRSCYREGCTLAPYHVGPHRKTNGRRA